MRVTGAQLRGWLERSAGLYNRLDPSRPGEQALIDGSFPGYNFDVIAGLRYRIDPTQPSRFTADGKLVDPNARRVVDLSYQGRPVADDDVFIVATNNYRAGGGGNFPGNDGTTTVLDAPDLTRDVIARYIVEPRHGFARGRRIVVAPASAARRARDLSHRPGRKRPSAGRDRRRADRGGAGRVREVPDLGLRPVA